MRHILTTTFSAAAFLAFHLIAQSAFAQATSSEPTMEGVSFAKIYIPVGFDSNDHVQFVGEGMFANTCYRPANVTVDINEETKTIKIEPLAYKYNGSCLQVVLPFNRTVDIGMLSPGNWQVYQTKNRHIGQITVAHSLTADPDDYLYAPISQAYIQEKKGKEELLLNGSFPNSCMKMKKVKFDIQDDVIVVQPIAQMASGSCAGPSVPFTQVVELGAVKAGRYLLHVRSINGNAINTLVQIK